MKCFKVVKSVYKCGGGAKMVSSFVSGKAQVEYEIGKLTTPPDWLGAEGYGILAYGTLKDVASRYLGHNEVVLECAVMGPQRELPAFCSIDGLRMGQCVPAASATLYSGDKFPTGTVMFDGVIPMRVVPMREVREAATL